MEVSEWAHSCLDSVLLPKRRTTAQLRGPQMKALAAIASLILVGGLPTFAHADDISLGQPGYGGTGCPGGSVSATLSPDAKSLSILFDQYQVEAGGDTGK